MRNKVAFKEKINEIEKLLEKYNIKRLYYHYNVENHIVRINKPEIEIEEAEIIYIDSGELRIYKKLNDSATTTEIKRAFPIQTPDSGDLLDYTHTIKLVHPLEKGLIFFENLQIELNAEPLSETEPILKDYKLINPLKKEYEFVFEDRDPKTRKRIEKFLFAVKVKISELLELGI